jgi:hypothetical protein
MLTFIIWLKLPVVGVSLATKVNPLLPLAESTSLNAGTMWSKLAAWDSKSTSGLERIGTEKDPI